MAYTEKKTASRKKTTSSKVNKKTASTASKKIDLVYRIPKGSTLEEEQKKNFKNLPYTRKPGEPDPKLVPLAKKTSSSTKSSGTGYTATKTNRKTGKKTTTSGTLTPVAKSAFVSGAVANGAGKMMRKSTPLTKKTSTTSKPSSITKKKLY